MELPNLALAGFSILVLIPATTQFLKEMFTIEGKPAVWLAFGVGVFYALLAGFEGAGLLEALQPWVQIVVVSFLFGINATGLYKLVGSLAGSRE